MISPSSRYANSQVVVDKNLAGADAKVIVPSIQIAYTFNFILYQLKSVDTLTTLAFEHLGDPTLWWVIADGNPEIMQWDDVEPGTIIRIPLGGPH